ncbi:hypothetical protein OROGR_015009 [Orobanche gracilis]
MKKWLNVKPKVNDFSEDEVDTETESEDDGMRECEDNPLRTQGIQSLFSNQTSVVWAEGLSRLVVLDSSGRVAALRLCGGSSRPGSGFRSGGIAFTFGGSIFANIRISTYKYFHQFLFRDQICCAQRNLQYEVRADYFACACQQKIDGYNGTSFYNFTALYIIH